MSSDIAIRVSNLSKCYEIYDNPRDRLKQFVLPKVKRVLGQEPFNYYREFWALRDVSFEVRRGETVGIVGRNGSGKSTLLQMICGTLSPTNGTVEVFGRVAALLELGSGFNPEFTGRENVYMNASILGLTQEEIESRLGDIAAFADIGDFIEQPVKAYSSGMLMRLAFAVIAHADADVLVIDEALAVGDAFFVQKCMRFLRKFMENGTILFVSHDTNAVVNLCNNAVLLEHGVVKMLGAPKDVTTQYLEDFYEDHQGEIRRTKCSESSEHVSMENVEISENDYRDMRQDFFNSTIFRNDIQLYKFNQDASSFGTGGASIYSVTLSDENDNPLSWVVGGEMVSLKIKCDIKSDVYRPIVGFQLKDNLGQLIFGDVTSHTDMEEPPTLTFGQKIVATFNFRFPIMPPGAYSISPAIADGVLDDHIQLAWYHDALILQVHASSVCFGLISIPMKKISLKILN